jgi:molybdate transport system substrate-binding protein
MAPAQAAEITVLVASAFSPVMTELAPQFERTSGHSLVTKVEVGGVLRQRVLGGEAFDLAILDTPDVDDLIKQGKMAMGSRADIARAGIGVAVRKGAAKPDVSSAAAFKQTMLAAKSVAFANAGASGAHFLNVLARLGIADEMKPKLRPAGGSGATEAVIKGDAELVVVPIPPIVGNPQLDLVGPLPPDLQLHIGFSAGLSPNGTKAEASRALVSALKSPDALRLISAKGMEAGAP